MTRRGDAVHDTEPTLGGESMPDDAATTFEEMTSAERRARAQVDDAVERYPVPASPPVYQASAPMVSTRKRTPVWDVVAALFVVLSLVLTAWLAIEVLGSGGPSDPLWFLYAVMTWAMFAYLAIPRVHQVLSLWYVPDYFIGRTRTGDGILGDPVNLAFDGQEEDIHAAMQVAGWTLADEITLRSSWGIIVSSVLRRSYPAAPVSDLFLFGRRHAFAYQREVDGNASRRHHVRFWPVPEGWALPGGERVGWLAAGTYDRSVGLSGFTGQVTHKIDADVDAERDFIVDTLRYADPIVGVRVIEEFSTAYHARNGGGDAIRTDGDMPVVDVVGAAERNPEPAIPPVDHSIARHHVPPKGLLIAGVFVFTVLIFNLVYALAGAEEGMQIVIGPAVSCVLWLLTAARYRWAWVGLMATTSLATALLLAVLDFTSTAAIVSVSFLVFVVLAVCGNQVREWVRPRQA